MTPFAYAAAQHRPPEIARTSAFGGDPAAAQGELGDDTSVNSYTPTSSPDATQQDIFALNVGGAHIDVAPELLANLPTGNLLHGAIVYGPRVTSQHGAEPRVFVPRSPTTFRLMLEYYSNNKKLPKGLPDHVVSALKMEARHFALRDLHAECKVLYPLRRQARQLKAAGATQARATALRALATALREHGLTQEAQRKQLRAAQLLSELAAAPRPDAVMAPALASAVRPPEVNAATPRLFVGSPTRRHAARRASRDANALVVRRPSVSLGNGGSAARPPQSNFAPATPWNRISLPNPGLGLSGLWPLQEARLSGPAQRSPTAPAPRDEMSPPGPMCTNACGPLCAGRAPQETNADATAFFATTGLSPYSFPPLTFSTHSSPPVESVDLPYALDGAMPAPPTAQSVAAQNAGILATSAPAALGFTTRALEQAYVSWPPAPRRAEAGLGAEVGLGSPLWLQPLPAGDGDALADEAGPSWPQTFARVRTWSAEVAAQGGHDRTTSPTLPMATLMPSNALDLVDTAQHHGPGPSRRATLDAAWPAG